MLRLVIKETATSRRIAFKGLDFVAVMKERGWEHFHAITPELKRRNNIISEKSFINLMPLILEKYRRRLLETFNQCKPSHGDSLQIKYDLKLEL